MQRQSNVPEWEFPNGIIFSANFDSGNLEDVIQVGPTAFRVTINNDADTDMRTWFLFSVSGVTPSSSLRITVGNMKRLRELFTAGYRPCVADLDNNIACTSRAASWQRVGGRVSHTPTAVEGQYALSFSHKCKTTRVAFAFCYPYTLESYEEYITNLEACFPSADDPIEVVKPEQQASEVVKPEQHVSAEQQHNVYFHKQRIAQSKQGRSIDLLTITSYKGHLGVPKPSQEVENQECVGNVSGIDCSIVETAANFLHSKRVAFISCRVHPGETPSSYALEGFIDFVARSDSVEAQMLRDNFVFKIIPILNPDGVYLGHYRGDSDGQNLNRFYDKATLARCPSIASALWVIDKYHRQGRLSFYLDFHAHASKQGCFVYGNNLSNLDQQVSNLGFAALVASLCPDFDYSACNFSRHNMSSVDRHGESKEGSGRVSVFRRTCMVHCYTLECNYWCNKQYYGSTKRSTYSCDTWRSVGRACAMGMSRMLGHGNEESLKCFSETSELLGRVYRNIRYRHCYKGQQSKYNTGRNQLSNAKSRLAQNFISPRGRTGRRPSNKNNSQKSKQRKSAEKVAKTTAEIRNELGTSRCEKLQALVKPTKPVKNLNHCQERQLCLKPNQSPRTEPSDSRGIVRKKSVMHWTRNRSVFKVFPSSQP